MGFHEPEFAWYHRGTTRISWLVRMARARGQYTTATLNRRGARSGLRVRGWFQSLHHDLQIKSFLPDSLVVVHQNQRYGRDRPGKSLGQELTHLRAQRYGQSLLAVMHNFQKLSR